jgi:hypothetical protein
LFHSGEREHETEIIFVIEFFLFILKFHNLVLETMIWFQRTIKDDMSPESVSTMARLKVKSDLHGGLVEPGQMPPQSLDRHYRSLSDPSHWC